MEKREKGKKEKVTERITVLVSHHNSESSSRRKMFKYKNQNRIRNTQEEGADTEVSRGGLFLSHTHSIITSFHFGSTGSPFSCRFFFLDC